MPHDDPSGQKTTSGGERPATGYRMPDESRRDNTARAAIALGNRFTLQLIHQLHQSVDVIGQFPALGSGLLNWKRGGRLQEVPPFGYGFDARTYPLQGPHFEDHRR